MKYKIIKISHKYNGVVFVGYYIKKLNRLIPINIDEKTTCEVQNKLSETEVGEIDYD